MRQRSYVDRERLCHMDPGVSQTLKRLSKERRTDPLRLGKRWNQRAFPPACCFVTFMHEKTWSTFMKSSIHIHLPPKRVLPWLLPRWRFSWGRGVGWVFFFSLRIPFATPFHFGGSSQSTRYVCFFERGLYSTMFLPFFLSVFLSLWPWQV